MKKDEELGMKMINIFSHIHTFKWNSERKEVNYKICFEQIIHEAFYHNNKIKSLYKNFFKITQNMCIVTQKRSSSVRPT